MVELALVFILLVMLLVGTVSAAVAYGRSNSIQNAAREASRFGATLPGPVDAAWFQDVQGVAESAAQGDLDAVVPNSQICVAFIKKDDSKSHFIDIASGVQSGGCPGYDDGRDGNEEARVNVVTQRDTPLNAILFSVDMTLESEASGRYEREVSP